MEILAGATYVLFWVAFFGWLFDEPKPKKQFYIHKGEIWVIDGHKVYKP